MFRNRRGFMLLLAYLVIGILFVFAGMFVFKSIWEAKAAEKQRKTMVAFYLAEAGVDKAVAKLPGDTSQESDVSLTDNNNQIKGEYSYTISEINTTTIDQWKIESWGYVPTHAQVQVKRHVIATVARADLPSNFWNNAIYTAGTIRLNGSAYNITGTKRYGDSLVANPSLPVENPPTYIKDATIYPLTKLDFPSLRDKAEDQDNIFTAADIAGGKEFPTSFWYRAPGTDGADDPGEPNVVYVETDLILNGNIGTIGGFFVVVGDVITNPADTSETVINGNGQIDGCIYTTGQFRVNGGGQGLNVDGGVWAGSDGVRINGSVDISYNSTYMNAIKTIINPSPIVQLISWQEEGE